MRDLKLDRSDIDSGNKDPYWYDLSILFNDSINTEVNHDHHPSIDEFCHFTFDCSGFVETSKTLRKKHNEARDSVECGLVGCRRSGKIC